MKYKTREGIILTEICGKYLLVASAEAAEECPYLTEINETTAFCWRKLEEGKTEEELVSQVLEEYETEDEERMRSDIANLVKQLKEIGYIAEEKENE